jgi:CRP-like cAMP-binding protein
MVHTAQLAVCNSRHSLQQRLARWLLVAQDQLGQDEIPLTHQCLSRSLGVRRAGITTAMGQLEAAGLLQGGRGRLRILDREGLEAQSCECHRAIRAERQRITCEAAPEPLS